MSSIRNDVERLRITHEENCEKLRKVLLKYKEKDDALLMWHDFMNEGRAIDAIGDALDLVGKPTVVTSSERMVEKIQPEQRA